jgi:glycine/D-amino acid oxidase-like deaminating enzyme
MKRIYPDYTYSAAPRSACWWDETCAVPQSPALGSLAPVDVAIIGAGFTGLSAALHLAEAGVCVAVLDAEYVGWGASGRNGGFCCLGGSKLSKSAMTARYGVAAAREYLNAEKDAVDLVAQLLKRLDIDADTHSNGETQLAHRPRDMEALRKSVAVIEADYGIEPTLIEKRDLEQNGLRGDFHGALTTPVGFALNPRKYVVGLAQSARAAGAKIFGSSPVTKLTKTSSGWDMTTPHATLRAAQVIIGTNGYSSEDVPDWFSARYLPAQSNIIVTRPMTDAELAAQGWTSDQMCYDTRDLLHYFRLMPDRRFLFGMRGGLLASAAADAKSVQANRRDFEKMFPAWAHVETPNHWSGMVCLSRNLTPYVGPVPDMPGVFAGLAYHGNGVAMGTYSGKKLADLVQGVQSVPAVMQKPMGRFPLGQMRRAIMFPAYAGFALKDL